MDFEALLARARAGGLVGTLRFGTRGAAQLFLLPYVRRGCPRTPTKGEQQRRRRAAGHSGFAGEGQHMKIVSHRRERAAARAQDVKPEARHVLTRGASGALILGLAAAAAVAVPAAASASAG